MVERTMETVSLNVYKPTFSDVRNEYDGFVQRDNAHEEATAVDVEAVRQSLLRNAVENNNKNKIVLVLLIKFQFLNVESC